MEKWQLELRGDTLQSAKFLAAIESREYDEAS